MSEQRRLTPKEAAARLQVHTSTVLKWLHGGALAGVKRNGTRWLIAPEAVDAMLQVPPPREAARGPREASAARGAAARSLKELGIG